MNRPPRATTRTSLAARRARALTLEEELDIIGDELQGLATRVRELTLLLRFAALVLAAEGSASVAGWLS